ncbi:DUF6197 family protein [Streptomyces syringium]|uniref:DUF6197 family protein n=1 Tax=Streptomyces syringium TaxID=76729 RepID=UPI003455C341
MTMRVAVPASPPQGAAELGVDGSRLVEEIERYLAGQARPATAHPLVTRTTAELVAEAEAGLVPPVPAVGAVVGPSSGLLRLLPDWVLLALRPRHGAGRRVSVAEHLELTALVIERYGWTRHQLRNAIGARCIKGAQLLLIRLGYGDEATAIAAGRQIQAVLTDRGITQLYDAWNDVLGRTVGEVLYLLRQAAAGACDEAERALA